MVVWVHAPLFDLPVVVLRVGIQGEEAHEDLLVTGSFSLSEQFLGMIGIFKVFVSVIGSCMTGNELVPMIDADPVRIAFEGEL